jgi:hypothetical protein
MPISLPLANEYIARVHRHHDPVQGHKFSLACVDEHGQLRGVMVVGRPVSRDSDDGHTLEVTRVATDGCDNACSFLYGLARRIAKEMGYRKIQTYTLISESGTSLKAAGWRRFATTSSKSRTDRLRRNADLVNNFITARKLRWECILTDEVSIDIKAQIEALPSVEKERPEYEPRMVSILTGRIVMQGKDGQRRVKKMSS